MPDPTPDAAALQFAAEDEYDCCKCGGWMLPWNGSRVYRDADDITVLRCVDCGSTKRAAALARRAEGGER